MTGFPKERSGICLTFLRRGRQFLKDYYPHKGIQHNKMPLLPASAKQETDLLLPVLFICFHFYSEGLENRAECKTGEILQLCKCSGNYNHSRQIFLHCCNHCNGFLATRTALVVSLQWPELTLLCHQHAECQQVAVKKDGPQQENKKMKVVIWRETSMGLSGERTPMANQPKQVQQRDCISNYSGLVLWSGMVSSWT